jgi:FkbM family methyltransferase
MSQFAILDFGPSIDTRHIEAPIDADAFAAFERRFAPLLARRDEIRLAIPGGETWPSYEPTREKILEYFLTVEALQPGRDTTYMDVASCTSLFPNYLAEVLGSTVVRQDLYYEPGRRPISFRRILGEVSRGTNGGLLSRAWSRLGGRDSSGGASSDAVTIDCVGSDACAIPLPERAVDAIGLQCSLEHFENDADGRFAVEAFRLLRPGGALLVIPFYCGFEYQEVFKPEFAAGCRFHRFYDPPAFHRRVLSRLPPPFHVEVRYYTNHRDIDPSFYCAYSVCVRKGDGGEQDTLGERYDRQTIAIMERALRRDSCCVDVGCNVGTILSEILRIAPEGRHYAFEPLPDLFRALKKRFGHLGNVELHEIALSDHRGRSTFQHVVTNHAYSGFRRRRYDRPNEEVVEIGVDAAPLDEVIPSDRRVDFIKIDVEGAELEVLRGARATITRCRPLVVFEHGLGGSDFYGTSPEAVYDLLVGECGLRISLLGSWLDGQPPLSREALARQFHDSTNFYFLAHP